MNCDSTITIKLDPADRKLLEGVHFDSLGAVQTLLGEREGMRRYLLHERNNDIAKAVDAVTRERDRLRHLAEEAFDLIREPGMVCTLNDRVAAANRALHLLQDGLNATPLDSPDGTAGGQEYENHRRGDQHQAMHEGVRESKIAILREELRLAREQIATVRVEFCHANERAKFASTPHPFVSTGTVGSDASSRADAYCDVCHNSAANEIHTVRR